MIKSGSPQPLGTFEERLLTELTAVVAQRVADPAADPAADHVADPASDRAAPAPGRRRVRRRLVPATLAGAAVAAAALTVVHVGTGAEAAYAVEKQADGSILINVRDSTRLDGLSQRLADVGLPALVVPMTASCPDVHLDPFPPSVMVILDPVLTATPGTTVRVQVRGSIPAGKRLVFGVATPAVLSAKSWSLLAYGGLTAHPPTCLPVYRLTFPVGPATASGAPLPPGGLRDHAAVVIWR